MNMKLSFMTNDILHAILYLVIGIVKQIPSLYYKVVHISFEAWMLQQSNIKMVVGG
jgi:hypothetical protein